MLFSVWFELGLDPAVANDDLNSMKSKEDNNSGSVLVFDKTMVQINLWFGFYFLLNSCVKKNIWSSTPAGPVTEAALSTIQIVPIITKLSGQFSTTKTPTKQKRLLLCLMINSSQDCKRDFKHTASICTSQ